MAPMMRRSSLFYWLALWVTLANLTAGTLGSQQSENAVSGSAAAAASGDWPCPLEKWSLEERHNRSQVVFTALIESCETNDLHDDQEVCQRHLLQQADDANLVLNVRVKKVVKGLDRLWEGRLVRVEGLRDPRICPSRVRLRDTRIFLASYVNQASADEETVTTEADHHQHVDSAAVVRLRLNSSLMAVSLRHLQQLRAFTKGSRFFLHLFIFLPCS